MITVTVSLEREPLEKIRPLIARNGMNVSSFIRKSINDYIDKEAVKDEWKDRKHE